MQRKTLLASTLALLLAGPATFALAQDTNPPPPAGPGAPQHDLKEPHGHHGHDDHGMRGGPGRFGFGPDMSVISDLHDLERLYLIAGRGRELPSLYNQVLDKSQDPRVRDYAYHQLARAQAQPANVDAAIATLRKSLDENLANEARRHAEMEQWGAHWQPQRATAAPAAPAAQ